MEYHISPAGHDGNPGTAAQPFASIEHARDVLRGVDRGALPPGEITIVLHAGLYELSSPVCFGKEDSGSPDHPLVYRAETGAKVRISGGRTVSGWGPVTDREVLARLPEVARGHVLQVNLAEQGITDYEGINHPRTYQSDPGLEVFYADRPMTLARYPNEGFMWIKEVFGETGRLGGKEAKTADGKFLCEDPASARWVGEKDVWLHGFWFRDWADIRIPLGAVDPEAQTISFPPRSGHAYAVRKGQWFYAENVLPELDSPGEWYLDREAGILYFWPPGPVRAGVVVSLTRDLFRLTDVSDVTFRGLLFEAGRGSAVVVTGGSNVRVIACTIRNMGNWAVRVTGGNCHGVVGCDVYATGQGGIHLEGGDRATLVPAGHYADNNHIYHTARWDPVYQQAITLYGVGNRATHNLIDNVPHIAIGFSHNDHIIEYNEIHSSVFQSNDAGAIYTSPPNETWTMRGHRIRYNYLHNIHGFEGRGCNGVYLDDCFSSADISGNIFYDVATPILIGGGRDNRISNNLFIKCRKAFHLDARGLGWAKGVGSFATKEAFDLKITQPPWSVRYPELVNLLEDEPLAPKGNVLAGNICWQTPWGWIEPKAMPFVTSENNLTETDPHFAGCPPEDFCLASDSPAWGLGFRPIPVAEIGVYESPDRASWPVTSVLRQDPEAPAPKPKPVRKPGPKPVYDVPKRLQPVKVDGILEADEWFGLDAGRGMPVKEGVDGESVPFATTAWLAWDNEALYVAFDNAVDPAIPMEMDDAWGGNDAVEIAFSNGTLGSQAPILVLRGFACGSWMASDEAGASAGWVRETSGKVSYAARVVSSGRWTAEWRIPFTSLGVTPKSGPSHPFNLSVRKQGDFPWVMWRGTGNCTWYVAEAGLIRFSQ